MNRSLVSTVATAFGLMMLALILIEGPLVHYRVQALANDVFDRAEAQLRAGVESGTDRVQLGSRVSLSTGCQVQQGFSAPADSTSHRSLQVGGESYVLVFSPATANAVAAAVREFLWLVGLLGAFAASTLVWALRKAWVRPARRLTQVADALAEGDLSVRASDGGQHELGDIGRSLDRMAGQMEARIMTLRGEQARLGTVLDAMVEAVFVADPIGRITRTNDAFEALVGPDSAGHTAMEVLGCRSLHDAVRAARHQQSEQVEFVYEHLGVKHDLTAEVAPLPEGTGVVVVLHDVTRLRLADRVRRDFVANASHELRTPLTAIRGYAETLRDGALHNPDAAVRFLDIILKHALRLDALVNDLSALSKAESPDHPLEIESVDVVAAIEDVLHGLSSKAEARDVKLRFDVHEPVMAQANSRALDQVVLNLIDNAIKYTPDGSEVLVTVDSSDKYLFIRVHNPGPGIPAIHHARLFERFYRVDEGRSREVGGTGLGLAIVKHLCGRMHGTATVKSAPGQGVTFSISLPLPS